MPELSLQKQSGYVGAEVFDVHLADISEPIFEQIQQALFTHGVLFFRAQHLTPEQHIAFAQRWGSININRFFTAVEGYPQIAEVRTQPDQQVVVGGTWHTDHSYDPAPAMVSILSAQVLPSYGGDTLFASMTGAYECLSKGLQSTLDSLKAWHSDGSFKLAAQTLATHFSDAGVTQPTLHPVIIRHPVTGHKALYVNSDFTTHFEHWSVEESAPLLSYLYRFATQPTLCCRFRWSPGTVAIWDNRLVQHFACADYLGQARLMHRITIDGVPLN